ncbi:hypothetical protein Tco_1473847 [Tanacetum coccineum]
MGESSRKTSLEHHEEQIKEILNHLDELFHDRIEHIEDKIEGLEKVQRQVVRDIIQWKSRYTLMPPKRGSCQHLKHHLTQQAAIKKQIAKTSVTHSGKHNAAIQANTVNYQPDARNAPVGKDNCIYKEYIDASLSTSKKYVPRTEVQKMERRILPSDWRKEMTSDKRSIESKMFTCLLNSTPEEAI